MKSILQKTSGSLRPSCVELYIPRIRSRLSRPPRRCDALVDRQRHFFSKQPKHTPTVKVLNPDGYGKIERGRLEHQDGYSGCHSPNDKAREEITDQTAPAWEWFNRVFWQAVFMETYHNPEKSAEQCSNDRTGVQAQ